MPLEAFSTLLARRSRAHIFDGLRYIQRGSRCLRLSSHRACACISYSGPQHSYVVRGCAIVAVLESSGHFSEQISSL